MIQLYLSFFIKSFKYIRKRSGLKIDPCGTPPLISPASEKISSVTKNFLLERNWFLKINIFYFYRSSVWANVSKALCRSTGIIIISLWKPLPVPLKIKWASCIRPESVEAFTWKHKVVFIQIFFRLNVYDFLCYLKTQQVTVRWTSNFSIHS